jgi:hypothetical protein
MGRGGRSGVTERVRKLSRRVPGSLGGHQVTALRHRRPVMIKVCAVCCELARGYVLYVCRLYTAEQSQARALVRDTGKSAGNMSRLGRRHHAIFDSEMWYRGNWRRFR